MCDVKRYKTRHAVFRHWHRPTIVFTLDSTVRCSKSAQKFAVRVRQVTTVAAATTRLVLSQFKKKHFLSHQLRIKYRLSVPKIISRCWELVKLCHLNRSSRISLRQCTDQLRSNILFANTIDIYLSPRTENVSLQPCILLRITHDNDYVMRPRSYSRGLCNRKTYANANANKLRAYNDIHRLQIIMTQYSEKGKTGRETDAEKQYNVPSDPKSATK